MQYLGLDLLGCRRMPDQQLAQDILGTICGKLHMEALDYPQIEHVGGEKGGITGFLIITESHIAFHSFHNYSQIYFDILSCRKFNAGIVEATLQDTFFPQDIITYSLPRAPLVKPAVSIET